MKRLSLCSRSRSSRSPRPVRPRGGPVARRAGCAAARQARALRSVAARRGSTSSACTGRARARSLFRTRSVERRWSAWRPAAPEAEDLPDSDARADAARGWKRRQPVLDGPSDRDPGADARPRDAACAPTSSASRRRTRAAADALARRLAADRRRASAWGANESIRRAAPPLRAAAPLRRRPPHGRHEQLHARAVGRDRARDRDLPREGQRLERHRLQLPRRQVRPGLRGPLRRRSSGTSSAPTRRGSTPARSASRCIGNYEAPAPTAAALDALVDAARVAARRRPRRPARRRSRGPRAATRASRRARRSSCAPSPGHRDTGFTDCPGRRALRAAAAHRAQASRDRAAEALRAGRAGAASAAPCASRRGSRRRCRGRSRVTDAAGTIAGGRRDGHAVDWTWDATAAARAVHVRIDAGRSSARRRARRREGGARSRSRAARRRPAVVHAERRRPRRLGRDRSRTLSAPATVTVDAASTPRDAPWRRCSGRSPAGTQRSRFTADAASPDGALHDRRSRRAARRRDVTRAASRCRRPDARAFVAASVRALLAERRRPRSTRSISASSLVSPRGARARDPRTAKRVANVFDGPARPAAPQMVTWNGKKPDGRLRDGAYEADVIATNELGTVAQRVPFAVDTTPPTLRLVSVRPLRVRVLSEPRRAHGHAERQVVDDRPQAAGRSCRSRRRRCGRCAWSPATRPGTVSAPLTLPPLSQAS